ncbi:MAG: heme lyase CcmF/NrfE family subunit [Alphaproteobacteria bacterium]|nr:heme lyase CcmF/NrfE family subunit [Alphaproteobacteria bacterium]
MVPEIGHFALILAFFTALAQAALPLLGGRIGEPRFAAFGRQCAVLLFILTGTSFACLVYSYAVSDFTVLNVVQNSHTTKPFIYKLTGAWGNHEGSMLLWVLILALYGAVLARGGRAVPAGLHSLTLSVQGMIAAAFIAFVLFTSDPFTRVFPAPPNGEGLNPLLQDKGLAVHPPFLYLGYVGFSVPFAFAVAALIRGRADSVWARLVRPWALTAWTFLTIGITLGSWWAYYELGWGGWWAWDPVENASFMPWLAGVALIHSIRVVERRDALKGWAVLLAILTFSLSLVGTFLVRSGVLTSVHAFAVDPARGAFILMILAFAIGGSLTLFAIRGATLQATGAFAPVSRESALIANNVLLVAACATVFTGTFYPLFVDVLSGEKISVGPPYFNRVFVPIAAATLALAAGAMLIPWKKASLTAVSKKLLFAGVIAAGAGVLVGVTAPSKVIAGGAAVALVAWLVVGTLTDLGERTALFRRPLADSFRRATGLPRATWGASLAHIGIAVYAAGAAGMSLWKTTDVIFMKEGDTAVIHSISVKLDDVRRIKGPNWIADSATFIASKANRAPERLEAERRFYPVRGMQTTEAAIHPQAFGDLYITIGDHVDGKGWPVRIYFNPFVACLWWGAATVVFGGVLSISDRGKRPRRKVLGREMSANPAGRADPQPAIGMSQA